MAPEIRQSELAVVDKRESVDKREPAEKAEPIDKRKFEDRFKTKYDKWYETIEQKKDLSEQEAELERLEDRAETNSEPPTQKIIGFKNEVKSMENFLLDRKVYKEFKSLVIVGEYGVGKTALCQKIFSQENVKSVYAPRIWVSMHSTEKKAGEDNKISVLKRILKDLGVEKTMVEVKEDKKPLLDFIHEEAVEEASNTKEGGGSDSATKREISALLYALHLNLRWKKYLIVFDDVREEDDWNEKLDEKLKEDEKWGTHLSDGFPKGSGGRVIYTTRDKDLAKKLVAEEHEIHRLWPLTDSKSVWDIYEASYTEEDEEDDKREPPRNDKKCIDELMNKSRGLPLAARLLGKLEPVFLDDEKVPGESVKGAAGPGVPAGPGTPAGPGVPANLTSN